MWAIITLASLAVILILVLCVPLDFVFRADVYGKPKFRLRLSWLFGLVGKELTGREKPEEKKKAVADKREPRKRGKRARAVFAILRSRGLLRQIRRLLCDVLRRFNIKDLGADFRVGLGDPADTGLLFALVGSATVLFPRKIRVEPSFEDEVVFEGYSYGTLRLQPIRLVSPFVRFVFSLATLRVIKKLVLTKWRK